ncbi:uncharacterized protein LOC144903675 [Branchiostoma floridae x Branchiostoma belcheri]
MHTRRTKDTEPPVLFLFTHKDKVTEEEEQDFHDKTRAHLKGKVIDKQVIGRYFSVDNTKRNPEDPNVTELRKFILELAKKQSYMGEKIPIKWLVLKSKLQVMHKQGKRFCTLKDAIEAIGSPPEGTAPEENAISILAFWHLCGDIIYFPVENLRNLVILDPQWFVDVCKTIITIPEYQDQHRGDREDWDWLRETGELRDRLIESVWRNREDVLQYNLISLKQELLDMMEKFDLVLRCHGRSDEESGPKYVVAEEGTYFVPALLTTVTDERKLYPSGTTHSQPIFIVFDGKFCPVGLYHRMVVSSMRRYFNVKPQLAYASCARFITGNLRQTFLITKAASYLKVELVSSVQDEAIRFSHGPSVRKGLDEDLRQIIDKWAPGIRYRWCLRCSCADHREKGDVDRFLPIASADEAAECFKSGEVVCQAYAPATTTVQDVGLAHWFQNIPVILLINNEYGTSKGGISTINLEAVQTLRGKAVKDKTVVYCTALRVPEQDQKAADKDGVTLITPYQSEGDKREPSLDWLTHDFKSHFPKSTLSSHEYQESRGPKSMLPPHVDVIVGHAHITDTAARNVHDEYYMEADLIMFTHVLPEDTEYFKGGERAMKASKKEDAMLSQVHNAKAAFSVGHQIFKHFKTKYRGSKKPREHHLFFPRPSKVFQEVDIEPDSGEGELVVLSIGRVKNVENLKGYNLAARAIGIVRKYLEFLRWITRGISEDDWEKSMKILEANLNSGDLKPTLRPYGTQEDIRNDMMTAHLVLMPSRSEPFGLVGLEAIAAGIPVLISDKSGLADMIKKFVNEKKLPRGLLNRIVETSMQDSDMDKTAEKWAAEIRRTLTDTMTAFKQAKEFKDELLKSKYWEDSEREFLQACGITGSPEKVKPNPQDRRDEVTAQKDRRDKVTSQKDRRDEVTAQKDRRDEVTAQKDRRDKVTAQKDRTDEVIAQKDRRDEVTAQKDRRDKVTAQNDRRDEVTAQKDRRDEVTAQKDRRDEVTAQKDRRDKVTAQKDRTDEVTAQKDRRDEVTAQKDRRDEVTAQKDRRDEVTAQKDRRDEVTAQKDRRDEVTAQKDRRDEVTAQKDRRDEVTAQKDRRHEVTQGQQLQVSSQEAGNRTLAEEGSPEEVKPKVPGEAGVSRTTQGMENLCRGPTPSAGNGEPSSQSQVSSGSLSESVRFTMDVQKPAVESLPCSVTVKTNNADLTGGKVAPQIEVTSPQGKTTLIQTTHTSPPLAAGKGQTSRVSRVWGAEWRPQQSGKHTLGVCMGGRKDLCSLTVDVSCNNPVMRLGEKGSQQGQFNWPGDVAVRGDRLYVADYGNDRVQVFDLSGKFCDSFPTVLPKGLAVQTDGTIVVNSGKEVKKFSPSGELLHKFPLGEYCTNPYGLAVQRDGRVVVADERKHSIFLFEADGTLVKQVGGWGKGEGEGQFNGPYFVCVDKEDNIIVADKENHRVQVFDRNLNFRHKFGQYGEQPQDMSYPNGVSADSRGNIVLANTGGVGHSVKLQVFRPDGTWVSTISSDGDKLKFPHGVAVTEDGHVFVAYPVDECIRKYRYM